jgi:hypothetical protein
MVKIIAPFLIKGTIGDMNFVVTADGNNYARLVGKPPVSPHEFKNNPVFDRIRNHGLEFGQCAKKAVVFRQLAVQFNKLAKEGSFAGRATRLLFEILQEDQNNERGKRTISNGLKTQEGMENLILFESNKLRPLRQVLALKEEWNQEQAVLTIAGFIPAIHLDWPEEATQVQLAVALANWDNENGSYDTKYSDPIILDKASAQQTVQLTCEKPIGNDLQLTFIFIGFTKQNRKKTEFLHRKFNTATLIAYHSTNSMEKNGNRDA